MAGRSMALDVMVRLRDRLSGPFRRLRNNLKQLTDFGRRIGVLGAAIGAISFMAPIQEAAAFQQKLIDIAGTAELTGRAAFDFTRIAQAQYEGLALQIGQHSDTIADGVGQMVAAGLSRDLVDATIGDIGRATTAANASFSDMSGVGISMLNNLKLPADQMRDSLGALVVAGKLGSFELKDMAASFPTLTSGVAKFGVKGREAVNFLASALQIARKGTADPASAANNLGNFLDKALAPLTKKKFAEAGVDIEAVMMDAAAKGLNPIEAVVQKIGKLTGVSESSISGYMKQAKKQGLEGAEALGYVREQLEAIGAAGKVGELFQDKQVLEFLVPFLANIEEYKDIKAKVAAATGAITDADFATQMEGINRDLTIFKEIGTQATRMVGMSFAEWLPGINAGLIAALTWVRELDKSTGGMVKRAITFAGAGLLVVAALGALGFVLPIVGAGLGAIAALIGVILSPIGLVIAALGGAGLYIWKNWDRYGGQIMRLWDRAKSGIKGLASEAVARGRDMIASGRELAARYGPAIAAGFQRAWENIRSTWGGMASWFDANWGDIKARASAFWGQISAFGVGAWEDIKAGWQNAGTFFDGLFAGLDGMTIGDVFTLDSAKVAAFTALGAALDTIKFAWDGLRDFGTGFAPFLRGIGEDVGGTIKAIVEIGEGLWRLGAGLAQLVGIDTGKVGGVFTLLGDIAGGTIGLAAKGIRLLADAISAVVNGLADLVEHINESDINWEALIPNWVSGTAHTIAAAVRAIATAFNALKTAIAGFTWPTFGALPGDVLPNGTPAGDPNKVMPGGLTEDRERSLEDNFGVPVIRPILDTDALARPVNDFAGKMKDDLSVTAKPIVDQSSLDAALAKATNLQNTIRALGNTRIVLPGRSPGQSDVTAPPAANANQDRSSLRPATGKQFASISAPLRQEVNVGGAVRVQVEGPGRVVSAQSDNSKVPMTTGNGRMVGRA